METFRFDYEYEFDYEYDFLETFRFDYEFDYSKYVSFFSVSVNDTVSFYALQVAIDQMQNKVKELQAVITANPPDMKRLQLKLQGSISVTVSFLLRPLLLWGVGWGFSICVQCGSLLGEVDPWSNGCYTGLPQRLDAYVLSVVETKTSTAL